MKSKSSLCVLCESWTAPLPVFCVNNDVDALEISYASTCLLTRKSNPSTGLLTRKNNASTGVLTHKKFFMRQQPKNLIGVILPKILLIPFGSGSKIYFKIKYTFRFVQRASFNNTTVLYFVDSRHKIQLTIKKIAIIDLIPHHKH